MSLRDYLFYEEPGITLYCGDCREVLPLLPPKSVGMVLSDPPFSVPVKYQDADGIHPRSWGDLLVMEPFFRECFTEIRRVVRDTGHVYIHCDGETYPVFFRVGYSLWPQSHLIVWYKPSGRRGRGWLHSHELVLHLRTPATEYADGFRQDLIGIMPVRTLDREHPAEKPGELLDFLLDAVARPDSVLDPFAGSGSVLETAKKRNMQAIGIEIESKYCEIAVKRLRQGVLL